MLKMKPTVSATEILLNLKYGIELILTNNKHEVGKDSVVVQGIGEVLQFGLKNNRSGYWHLIRDLTHSSTRATIARALKHVYDNYDRGLFWIYFTLIEGSLESYMNVLVNETQTLSRFYTEDAILRDNYYSGQFLSLLTLLSDVVLTPVDSFFEKGIQFELGDVLNQHKTPPSPVDSGVTLLDSDENSLSETTRTEDDLDIEMTDDQEKKHKRFEEILKSRQSSFEDCHLSRVNSDSLVILRKKKKEEPKRVSFHEDVDEFEMKKSSIKRSPKERYSLPPDDFTYKEFLAQLFAPAPLQLQENASEALDLHKCEERGAPEGQEDPSGPLDHSEVSPEIISFKAKRYSSQELRQKVLKRTISEAMKHSVSKTSLLQKFLNSLPEAQKKPKRSLYLGPHPIVPNLNAETDDLIHQELSTGLKMDNEGLEDVALIKGLSDVLCCDRIYKVFKLSDLEGESLLGVVTDSQFFIMSSFGPSLCGLRRCILLNEIDTVVCGPKNEVVCLVLTNKTLIVLIPWFNNCASLCASLHIASLRLNKSCCRINFVTLSLPHMESLSESVQRHLGTKEAILDYFWVRGEETAPELRISKESYLMFSLGKPFKWFPAFVTLRGCTLKIKPEEQQEFIYNLKTCTTCDRVETNRPHTFLIKFNRKYSLIIAAPDNYEMSDWMQAILSAALKGRDSPTEPSITKPKSYGMVITYNHLIATQFPESIVKSTKLADISALRVKSAHCLIELDCHEVRETNGDWILYFSSVTTCWDFIRQLIKVIVRGDTEAVDSVYEIKEKQILSAFSNLVLSYS